MNITIEQHPARQRDASDRVTDKPLFPNSRSIRVNGYTVAYIDVDQPGRPITMIPCPQLKIAPSLQGKFLQDVKSEAEKLLGHTVGEPVVRPPVSQILEEADEDEDDNE